MKTITLTQEDMDLCERVGRKHYGDAVRRGVAGYGRIGNETRETGVEAAVHGQQGEAAVVAFFGKKNCRWFHDLDARTVDLKQLPDIEIAGVLLDAKSISKSHYSLLCQSGTVKKLWAYILVDVALAPICRILGYMWGEDVLLVPLTCPSPNRPAHLIPQGDPRLRPFEELAEHINARLKTPIIDSQIESDSRFVAPPDVDELCRKFGGYSKITPTAWREYDQALIDWKAERGMGSGREIGARFLLGVER